MDNNQGAAGTIYIRGRNLDNLEDVVLGAAVGNDSGEAIISGRVPISDDVSSVQMITSKVAVGKMRVYGIKL